MFKKLINFKIILFLIISDILETFIHFFFKKSTFGASEFYIDRISSVLNFLIIPFTSIFFWLAILSVVLIFIIWTTVLSKVELSVAVPIASFSYIFVPLVSIFLLGEKINFLRWVGIFLILSGIVFVSLSSKEK
ncbi:MAG: EamA family transporter [Candidatus Aenigmatarchaeota archaeon]